jgi:hypothetical protein
MQTTKFVLLGLLVIAFAIIPAVSAVTVDRAVNGGFETGTLAGWAVTQMPPQPNNLNGWIVSNANCYSGNYCAFGRNLTVQRIWQTINLTDVPSVSFAYRMSMPEPGTPNYANLSYSMNVYIDNTLVYTDTGNNWRTASVGTSAYTGLHKVVFSVSKKGQLWVDGLTAFAYTPVPHN